jgi:hypothetical protein
VFMFELYQLSYSSWRQTLRGREEGGDEVLTVPAEQHGARRTSAKLKDITTVISSRLLGESSSPQYAESVLVSFALPGRAGADPGGAAQT